MGEGDLLLVLVAMCTYISCVVWISHDDLLCYHLRLNHLRRDRAHSTVSLKLESTCSDAKGFLDLAVLRSASAPAEGQSSVVLAPPVNQRQPQYQSSFEI